MPGVRLFSLQKGYGTEQLAERRGQETLAERWGIVDLGERLDDFMDTAAVMMNLDLIISADTSPAHLAGALGRPVWLALPFAGCWRWLLDREDSPWYPTMRLFRQSARGGLERRVRTHGRGTAKRALTELCLFLECGALPPLCFSFFLSFSCIQYHPPPTLLAGAEPRFVTRSCRATPPGPTPLAGVEPRFVGGLRPGVAEPPRHPDKRGGGEVAQAGRSW